MSESVLRHDTKIHNALAARAAVLDRRHLLIAGASVAAAATAVSFPSVALAGTVSNAVSLTNRVTLSNIAGVIYAKPKVNTPPAYSCVFYPRATPASIADIYSTAAGTLSGGAPSYYGNWPSSVHKTYLDIDLGHLGYTAGQNAAIAFNLDDIVNADSEFRYCFTCTDPNAFSPASAITEGDGANTLSWIDSDDFQHSIPTGGGPLDGKTVVFVCSIIGLPSMIPFNLGITAFDKNDPTHVIPTIIDPDILNPGDHN